MLGFWGLGFWVKPAQAKIEEITRTSTFGFPSCGMMPADRKRPAPALTMVMPTLWLGLWC